MLGSVGGVPLNLPEFQGPAWMRSEQGKGPAQTFGVLPENWDAACIFFCQMPTQWRHDGAGVISGLRYDALELVIKHHACVDPDDTFKRVQFLERTAVEQVRRMSPKS